MLIHEISSTKPLKDIVQTVFTETFPLSDEIGYLPIPKNEKEYHRQPLVLLTSFLHLPNYPRIENRTLVDKLTPSYRLTMLDVFKNMIDWNVADERKGKMSTLDKVLALPMLIFFTLRALVKLPINILKLFTEFLPGLAEGVCRCALHKNANNYLAKLGVAVFSCLHFIGRSLTSPLKGWLGTYKQHKGLGMLSFALSCALWGLVGTLLVGGPALFSLSSAALGIQLIKGTLAIGFISSIGLPISALIKTSDGVVKPLLVAIGNLFDNTPPEVCKEHSVSCELSTRVICSQFHNTTSPQLQHKTPQPPVIKSAAPVPLSKSSFSLGSKEPTLQPTLYREEPVVSKSFRQR